MSQPPAGPEPAEPPPAQSPPRAAGEATFTPAALAPAAQTRRSMRISIPGIVIALVMAGSIAFIGYVVARVEDNQIGMLAAGFVALGASFAAIGVWALVGMWRAASRARGGRALLLAIVAGLAALGAIGCFAVAAVGTLVTTQ